VTTTAAAAGTRRHTGTYPAEPAQVRLARAALMAWLDGWPRVDEAILVASVRSQRDPAQRLPARRVTLVAVLPPPADAARVSCLLAEHLRWSAWWDKKYGVWRVAEDDPDSDLYAEGSDADAVIGYITAHV
jgi:hypothetical protein